MTETQEERDHKNEKWWNSQIPWNIANLLLTALIGIFVAIYLNMQSAQLQIELVGLQASTQRQATLAHLKVSQECLDQWSCLTKFDIKNTGLAAAKNVQVTALIYINSANWKNSLRNLSDFTIETSPASRNISIKEIKGSNFQKSRFGVELTVDTLPPGGAFQFNIDPAHSVLVDQYNVKRVITIDRKSLFYKDGRQFPFIYLLNQYLDHKFSLGTLTADSTCDNCEDTSDNAEIHTRFHFADSLQYKTPDSTNKSDWTWTGNLEVTYSTPKGTGPISIPTPLVLNVNGEASDGYGPAQPAVDDGTFVSSYMDG